MKITTGRFLKNEEFTEEGKVLYISKVEYANIAKENEEKNMKHCVSFEDNEKPLVLNSTNKAVLLQLFGDESDEWEGKPILVCCDPTVSYQGSITGGLRLKKANGKKKKRANTETV